MVTRESLRSTKGWVEHEPYSVLNICRILEEGGYKGRRSVSGIKSRDLEEACQGFERC